MLELLEVVDDFGAEKLGFDVFIDDEIFGELKAREKLPPPPPYASLKSKDEKTNTRARNRERKQHRILFIILFSF